MYTLYLLFFIKNNIFIKCITINCNFIYFILLLYTNLPQFANCITIVCNSLYIIDQICNNNISMRAIVLFLCNKCTVLNHDCLHFLLESSFTIINYCVSLIFINLFHNRTASLGAIDVSQCVVCKSKVKSLKTMKCRHTFCLECFKNRLMISYKEGIINLK